MIDYKDLYLNDPEFHALVEIASAGVMNYFKNNPSLMQTANQDNLNDIGNEIASEIAFSVIKELHKADCLDDAFYKYENE